MRIISSPPPLPQIRGLTVIVSVLPLVRGGSRVLKGGHWVINPHYVKVGTRVRVRSRSGRGVSQVSTHEPNTRDSKEVFSRRQVQVGNARTPDTQDGLLVSVADRLSVPLMDITRVVVVRVTIGQASLGTIGVHHALISISKLLFGL